MDLDTFGNKTENCFKFSKNIADVVYYDLKVVLCSIGILLSLFAIVLIGLSKIYKQFVYRLVMHLMAVNIIQALCQVIVLIPVEVNESDRITIRNGTDWTEVCAILGYLYVVTAWIDNFVIIWIMLYMLMLGWQLHRLRSGEQSTSPGPKVHNNNTHTCEIVGVILLVLSPFLFCWIPFVMHMYGISGLWCLIKTVSDDGCNNTDFYHLSLALMMVMFYGPRVGIIIFGLVCMISTIVLLQKVHMERFVNATRVS